MTANRLQHTVPAFAILVVAIAVAWISFTQEPADAFLFPRIVSIFFLLLATWNGYRAVAGLARVGGGIPAATARALLPGLLVALAYVFLGATALGFYAGGALAFLILYTLYDPAPLSSLNGWIRRIAVTAVFMAVIYLLFALLLTFVLARRLASRLSRPLSEMSEAVTAIQAGNYQAGLPEVGGGELATLARHINNLANGLQNAAQEQQQAMTLLIKAREESDLANRAKSDFLAMMSHELRTPMNGVLGMLQLLDTTEMSDEQREYAALAMESTEHLLKVINDILDFSRIERGALELELISFNLPTLLKSALQAFQHSAQQRGLQLRLELDDTLPAPQVQGDPTRLRQILVNLIGNALKFTERGEVRVEAHWQALDNQVLWFTCQVHDTGIGISAERLDTMFDAFQQADNSISRRYGGTGLGLPIARTLAECMGGTLTARSELGRGSCFTLEIPLPFSAHQPQLHVHPSVSMPSSPVERSVLLVEDNAANQTVIEAMLRSLGYQVELVGDGAQAISAVERKAFAAVLMDCRLPVMDGYEATRRIRELGAKGGLPIIALTANALQGDREACLQAGMNDYLAKPFKRTELQDVLERWLA